MTKKTIHMVEEIVYEGECATSLENTAKRIEHLNWEMQNEPKQ